MAVRRKGTVQPPEGAKPAEGEAKTEQKTESKKKGPSTQSVAGLVKYSVPKDVRKPRENSHHRGDLQRDRTQFRYRRV